MPENLVATVQQRRGGASVIKLVGVLDEHNELAALADKVTTGKTLINLSDIERVDAGGTRAWMRWLASLEARGIRPEIVACSPAVVAQLNLMSEFAGHGVVKSLQVPYHCRECGLDKSLVVNIADLGSRPRAPRCRCDGCGAAMVLVDETGDYFGFLDHLKIDPRKPESLPPDFARGSASSVGLTPTPLPAPAPPTPTPTPVRLSEPRIARPSSLYLSASQVSGNRLSSTRMRFDRPSQRQLPPPPAFASKERTFLIVLFTVLIATLGVMFYLVLR